MNKDEFITRYKAFSKFALALAVKARREGLLGLENDIDCEQSDARDIFHYGLRFAVDGISVEIIEKILSNLITQEKDEFTRLFKIIQYEAVIGIQSGDNPEILHSILNSYTDLQITEDSFPSVIQPGI